MKTTIKFERESRYIESFGGKVLRHDKGVTSFIMTFSNFEIKAATKVLNKFYSLLKNYSDFRIKNTVLSINESENNIKGIFVIEHTGIANITINTLVMKEWKTYKNELVNSGYKRAFCPLFSTCRYQRTNICNNCSMLNCYLPLNSKVKDSIKKVARNYSIKKLDDMYKSTEMEYINTLTHRKSELGNNVYTVYIFKYKENYIIGLEEIKKYGKNSFYVFKYTGHIENISINKFLEPVA